MYDPERGSFTCATKDCLVYVSRPGIHCSFPHNAEKEIARRMKVRRDPHAAELDDRCDNCITFRGSVPTFTHGSLKASSCACGKLRWASTGADIVESNQKAAFRAGNQTKIYLTPVERAKMNRKNGYCPHGWSNKAGCETCCTKDRCPHGLLLGAASTCEGCNPASKNFRTDEFYARIACQGSLRMGTKRVDPAMEGLSPGRADFYAKADPCPRCEVKKWTTIIDRKSVV